MNRFFRYSDPSTRQLSRYNLPADWWSRHYEYPWALAQAPAFGTVADMGTGWTFRPFAPALTEICNSVLALDIDRRVEQHNSLDNLNLIYLCHDFTIPLFEDEFDAVFCISVLEDLGDKLPDALAAFRQSLKRHGKIILTFDVQYDPNKPLAKYPGLDLEYFERTMTAAGLRYVGRVNHDKTNAVYHLGFNLCCYRCVLEQA